MKKREVKKMNLKNYPYLDLNITEVDNVVEILHDKTDDYLKLLFDDDWCATVEDARDVMLEYMRTVRSQTNVLSEIKSRLEKTNRFSNGLSDAKIKDISREMVERRYG